jgi:protein SCO1/2
MERMIFGCLCLAIWSLVCGCDPASNKSGSEDKGTNHGTSSQKVETYQAKGVVRELKSDGKTAVIRHQEIVGFMPAMVMPFEVRPASELKGLKAGDQVTFRLNVTDEEAWIDQIKKDEAQVASPVVISGSTNLNGLTFVKDREPLNVGDDMPNYHFTNEQNQAVSLSQFKGQALAITFIFTRCPLPNFCPLMSSNFKETQQVMEETASEHGTNWHLLTITFDPEFDSPVILKDYSTRFNADPAHWNFLTGDFIEITSISDQFGQTFWKDQGAINHNLRTAVIDSAGKVRKIYEGNRWTSKDLAGELTRAMGGAKRVP